jgi:hypothetical protein
MTSTEIFLLALAMVFAIPYLIWRLGRTDHWAPLVVVQILTGIALGPGVLGAAFPAYYDFVFNPQVVTLLNGVAWWGVMLFVFIAGVELDLAAAWREKRDAGTTALLAMVFPFALGCGAALLLPAGAWLGERGNATQFMLGIGMSCAVTALPILVLLMEKLAILRTPLGQRILRYASLDDIAIWAVLAVILAQWDRIGKQALFLAAFGLAAWGLRRLMRAVSERDRWYIAVVWLALASLGADWCGLHFMIGAFLAGAVLDAHWFDQRRMDLLTRQRAAGADAGVLPVDRPAHAMGRGWRHGVRGGGAVPGGRGGRQAGRRRPGRPAAGLVARRVAGHRPAAADQGADHDHLFQRAAGQTDHQRRHLHRAAADGGGQHHDHGAGRHAAARPHGRAAAGLSGVKPAAARAP